MYVYLFLYEYMCMYVCIQLYACTCICWVIMLMIIMVFVRHYIIIMAIITITIIIIIVIIIILIIIFIIIIIIIFIYVGESVSIWDDTRSSPLHSYKWGADSVLSVKFNPAESSLLASTGIVRKPRKNNYNNDDINSYILLSTYPFIIRIIVHSFLYSLTYLSRLGSDRSICLYDLRASVPMRKFLLPMNSNKVTYIYRW